MVWDKAEILQTLKTLHKQGEDLSYNSLAKRMQALVSAAAYHFGSYRIAMAQAGIDYAQIARRPRWTRTAIIKLIKEAKRAGDPLHWSAVCKRRDDLGKAGFASLQLRLFGSWDRALHAAGLDADDINQYRKWTKDTVVSELRARHRESMPLNSGAIQKDDPSLHAAAVRHFAGYDHALSRRQARSGKNPPAKNLAKDRRDQRPEAGKKIWQASLRLHHPPRTTSPVRRSRPPLRLLHHRPYRGGIEVVE